MVIEILSVEILYVQKTYFSRACRLLIGLAGVIPVRADSREEKQARYAEKVKMLNLGTGETAHEKVQLVDKTKLEGFISAADEEGFTVTNSKTGMTTRVAYPQVKSIKGNNLSTGAGYRDCSLNIDF